MNKSLVVLAVVVVAVVGTAYWVSKNPGSTMPAGESTTPQKALVLSTATSPDLGEYLVSANGMTLYLYTKDAPGMSNCVDMCAVNWPPYVVSESESLSVAPSISGAVSTVVRADGSKQLAYKGVPLYFWKNDMKPGDTTGQNVGGVWFVVKP